MISRNTETMEPSYDTAWDESPEPTTDEPTEVKSRSKKAKSKKTKSEKTKSKKTKSKKTKSKKAKSKSKSASPTVSPAVKAKGPSYKVIWIPIDTIKVNIGKRRPIIPGIVKILVAGIQKDGLRTPLTVRLLNGVAHLVAGLQRLEASRALGLDKVPCVIIRGKVPAQRWRSVENLHRGELTKLERANQTKALLELEGDSEEISGEKVQKSKRGRPEGGDAKAARTLPVRGKTPDAKRKNIAADREIADIHEDAQQALIEAGLDNNGNALREVADELTREDQLAKVKALAKGSGKAGDDDADQADDADDAKPPLVVLKNAWKKAKKLRVAWQNAPLDDRRAFIIEDLGYPLDEEPEDDEDDDEADD
jgi:ParB-like chromosome segregation protein Spo0J